MSALVIATHYPASQRSVEYVLGQDVETGDGRSSWRWIRLADGTLILGCFPQGDAYTAVTECEPWAAEHHVGVNYRTIDITDDEVGDLMEVGGQ